MTQRKLGKSWWVDITHNGVRCRKKSPDNSRAGAQAYEASLRRSLAEGVSIVRSEQKREQEQRYSKFVHFWFETYVLVHNKPSEIAKKKNLLNTKLLPYFGRMPLNEISSLHVELFKAKIAREGCSNCYINNMLRVLCKILRCDEVWNVLENIPKMKNLKVLLRDDGV